MRHGNVTAGLFTFLFLSGCNGGAQFVASRYFKSQLMVASQGGSLAVSSADSATLAGAQISVPPGALKADTRIGIGYGKDAPVGMAGAGFTAAGVTADLGPDLIQFNLPVTVTLPFTLPSGAQASHLMVFALESNGGQYQIKNDALQISGSLVTFKVTGFTQFQLGVSDYIPPPPDDGGVDGGADAGCSEGLTACPDGDGGTLCADTTSDPNNCGSCGYVCPQALCAGSNCVIDGGTPNDGGLDSGVNVDGGPDAGPCGEQVDYFGGFSNMADVLIVVDTSAGNTEDSILSALAPGFITAMEDSNIDFQVGVTTTDVCAGSSSEDGQLLPCPGCKIDGGAPLVITTADANAGSDLATLVLVGGATTDSCSTDAGMAPEFFEAANEALGLNGIPYNQGFVRPGARTMVLAVSGDGNDDESPELVDSYLEAFLAYESHGSAGVIVFQFDYLSANGLAADGGYIVDNSLLPPRLSAMMESSVGGLAIDSQGVNFENGLLDMLNEITLVSLPLSNVPDPATIAVYLDGPPPDRVQPGQVPGVQVLSTNPNSSVNWTYDNLANAIRLNGANLSATSSDTFSVEYSPAGCPGDDGGFVLLATGATCYLDVDCATQFCQGWDAGQGGICTDPTTYGCAANGQSCATSDGCCTDLCVNQSDGGAVCLEPPFALGDGYPCSRDSDCESQNCSDYQGALVCYPAAGDQCVPVGGNCRSDLVCCGGESCADAATYFGSCVAGDGG